MLFKRSDGRYIKSLDYFHKIIPYIMDKRYDASNIVKEEIECEKIKTYINEKKNNGFNISLMVLIIAAYVRTIAEKPELNRFVMKKRIYARNGIFVSFVILKQGVNETVVKIQFDPGDTVFDVAKKVEETIELNRKMTTKNNTDKLISKIFAINLIPSITIGLLKFLDRNNLMPKAVINASPFHTSLFITNMASIGMGYVYHHLYEFGTTTEFISIGKKLNQISLSRDNVPIKKEYYPLGIVTDERIVSGYEYAKGFAVVRYYLNNPHLLEVPPQKVIQDLI